MKLSWSIILPVKTRRQAKTRSRGGEEGRLREAETTEKRTEVHNKMISMVSRELRWRTIKKRKQKILQS